MGQYKMVKKISSREEWNAILEESKTKTVFVDFTATWCGPCQFIGPVFVELAEKNPGATFVKLDVDEMSDISQECGINAMPTFHVFKNGEKVDELVGADKD